MTAYVIQATTALLGLAALCVVAWLVARRYSSRAVARGGRSVEVIEMHQISVGARLLLVRAGKRVFLIALTSQSASLIAELSPEDLSPDASPDQTHADT